MEGALSKWTNVVKGNMMYHICQLGDVFHHKTLFRFLRFQGKEKENTIVQNLRFSSQLIEKCRQNFLPSLTFMPRPLTVSIFSVIDFVLFQLKKFFNLIAALLRHLSCPLHFVFI